MAGKKPCHYFQLGRCTKGDKCTYAHVRDSNFKRPPCKQFAEGRCSRGKDCKFSHVQSDSDALKAQNADSPNVGTTEEAFKVWRYNIPEDTRAAKKLTPAMLSRFCTEARELVHVDTGVMQQVITSLASEGGMIRIAELLDQDFEEFRQFDIDAQLCRIFNARLLPVLNTITHQNVTASPILEARVMTIFNFVYGPTSQRAVQMCGATTRYLSTLSLLWADDEEQPDRIAIEAFDASLAALSKVIEVNTTAQVNDALPPIVETLATMLENAGAEAVSFALRGANKHLARIQQRLGLGTALPVTEKRQNHGGRAIFELNRDLPGELSEDGPRHDNDKVDIRDISILPTLQEIQSSRTEYLPVSDPRDWHLGGLEGLLERNFRLLREDTVGQLRDAARFELERLQNPRLREENQTQKRHGARTYVYQNVTVSTVAFDSYRGLKFVISFDQPDFLGNRTDAQRREWWEGSKRMAPDALICLLSSVGSAIFFTVSQEMGSNKDANKLLSTGSTTSGQILIRAMSSCA